MLSGSTQGRGGSMVAPPPRPQRKPRFWLVEFYGTAIGKKAVMAITGIIGMGYVLVHMLGNLKLYQGENSLGIPYINEYAEGLREIGEPILPHEGFLWIARAVLILAVILHVHAAVTLTLLNRRSRPVGYKSRRNYMRANYASLTMPITGVLILFFIVFHLFDLTWGTANPNFESGEVYNNVVTSLDRWYVGTIYIVANLLLGLHLYHGAWSFFQSLGWNPSRFVHWRRYFALAFTAVIVIGNISFPIAVMTGVVS